MRVGVLGAAGKVGSTVAHAILRQPDMELSALVDVEENTDALQTFMNSSGPLIGSDPTVFSTSKTDVVVDFSSPSSTIEYAKYFSNHGINQIIGTTGFTDSQIDYLNSLFKEKPCAILIPNFSIGAILLMKFAEAAAKYFSSAEIIESHHRQKRDAPSGTAIETARRMNSVRSFSESIEPTEIYRLDCPRGGNLDGIRIHSLRLDGVIAKQEVIFGNPGESLYLVHESKDRNSYVPGVLLAVRNIDKLKGFSIGIEPLI